MFLSGRLVPLYEVERVELFSPPLFWRLPPLAPPQTAWPPAPQPRPAYLWCERGGQESGGGYFVGNGLGGRRCAKAARFSWSEQFGSLGTFTWTWYIWQRRQGIGRYWIVLGGDISHTHRIFHQLGGREREFCTPWLAVSTPFFDTHSYRGGALLLQS